MAKPNKTKKKSPFGWIASRRKKRAGKRVNAYVSHHDHDWQTDVPNMKLSKVFGFVLVLHVVAVIGILAYEWMNGEKPTPRSAEATAASTVAMTPAHSTPIHHAPSPAGSSTETRDYRVVSGDSVSRIAAKVGSTVEEVTRLNGLNSGTELLTGLILQVPIHSDARKQIAQADSVLGTSRKQQTVRPAQRALPKVLKARPVKKPVVKQTPVDLPPRRQPEPAPRPMGSVGFIEYSVQKGDTLYSISKRHGTTTEAIAQANGIVGNAIRIDQLLRIPKANR